MRIVSFRSSFGQASQDNAGRHKVAAPLLITIFCGCRPGHRDNIGQGSLNRSKCICCCRSRGCGCRPGTMDSICHSCCCRKRCSADRYRYVREPGMDCWSNIRRSLQSRSTYRCRLPRLPWLRSLRPMQPPE